MQKSALHRSVLDSVVAHERRGCGALAHAGRRKLAFLIEYRLRGGNVPTRPAEATCWSVSTWMDCRQSGNYGQRLGKWRSRKLESDRTAMLGTCPGKRTVELSGLRATPALGTPKAAFHQGYESTQPPEPPLNALLHNDCTGKVPVVKVMSAAAPCPEEIQAHLSPFSAPLESSQPPFGNWSVIVSAISWPETIVIPALEPRPLKLAPQLAPASVMYGRFV